MRVAPRSHRLSEGCMGSGVDGYRNGLNACRSSRGTRTLSGPRSSPVRLVLAVAALARAAACVAAPEGQATFGRMSSAYAVRNPSCAGPIWWNQMWSKPASR